jgi:exopolysaccharide biosynthesis polyprenyl glycosylphosphotransferase
MSTSVGVSRASRESSSPAEVDLYLVPAEKKQNPAADLRRLMAVCEALADLVTIAIAIIACYETYYHFDFGKHIYYRTRSVAGLAFALAVVMVLMLDRLGAYRPSNSLLRVRETEQLLRVSVQAFLIALTVSFFSSVLFSRWLLILCLILVPLALFLEKNLVSWLIRVFHSRGYGIEKVLIYGSGHTGRRVFSALTRSPKLGLDPIAFVDEDPAKSGSTVFDMGYEHKRSAPVIEGSPTSELIARCGVDQVIIAIPSIGRDNFLRVVEEAFKANVQVSFVPSHFLPSDPMVDYRDIDGVLLASFGKSVTKIAYEPLKRLCDIIGALTLLALGLPLYLALALLIKIDSRGSVLFRQDRVGHNGTVFTMFKFRTMHSAVNPYEVSPGTPSDSRITRVGRFLRKTSLDELPQLLNVLEGSMSLVGPRPEMPFIVEQYTQRHRQRLQVKPGLTGLWQLSGDRAFLIHENIEYDLYYIQHRNLFMDFAILLHTSIFAMRGI